MTGAIELQLDNGPRSSLSNGSGFRRCSGISSKFARRFTEGIGKLAGNTPGDHRKKIGRLATRMSEAAGLAGGRQVNRLYPGVRAAEPPRSAALASTSYSPPSLYARVVRLDRRSFAAEIHRVDTAREKDA
ncbi:hypothetical protein GW17_00048696 [Ensete ventricosum]|nr:hypothetical protein GW17_00048696 [Ensete ventricosum]